MYRPPHFDELRPDVLLAAIRAHPLGLLIRNGAQGLAADTIPFMAVADPGPHGRLAAHVARANPMVTDLRDGDSVLVVFQGPQHYVSPGWYATKAETGKVVPTWNYVMVQAQGIVTLRDDPDWVARQIHALTADHESPRANP